MGIKIKSIFHFCHVSSCDCLNHTSLSPFFLFFSFSLSLSLSLSLSYLFLFFSSFFSLLHLTLVSPLSSLLSPLFHSAPPPPFHFLSLPPLFFVTRSSPRERCSDLERERRGWMQTETEKG
jgi:hypothetical protein